MENYLLIALVIIVFWLIGFGVYLVVSSRQRNLEGELNHLSNILEDEGLE